MNTSQVGDKFIVSTRGPICSQKKMMPTYVKQSDTARKLELDEGQTDRKALVTVVLRKVSVSYLFFSTSAVFCGAR